ncbi:TPA: hypothetical protein ACH3X1_011112 [Trebouxia sp. C0004]
MQVILGNKACICKLSCGAKSLHAAGDVAYAARLCTYNRILGTNCSERLLYTRVTTPRSPGWLRPAALSTSVAQVVSLGVTSIQLGHMVQAWQWLLHTYFILDASCPPEIHSCPTAGHRRSIAVHNLNADNARLVETNCGL